MEPIFALSFKLRYQSLPFNLENMGNAPLFAAFAAYLFVVLLLLPRLLLLLLLLLLAAGCGRHHSQ